MSTIQFENGKKVTFEGTPTPKDIEEVARTMNIQPTPQAPDTSFGSKISTLLGSAGTGLGAKLPLMAIDYFGKKAVDKFGSEQMKKNLANSPTTSQQYDKAFDIDKNPKTAYVGEKIGQIGGAATLIKSGISAVKNIPSVAKNIAEKKGIALKDISGGIVQGEKADRPKALNVFSNLDTSNVKTYDDLTKTLNEAITHRAGMLDKVLETNPAVKKLKDLSYKVKIGDKEVAHNYVKDSLDQLKNHYLKTNNVEDFAKIRQLEAKATKEGLSVKEINDIARQHGRELNAFNADGVTPSTGLSKQAAENTRTGLKDTAKGLFKNDIYDATDKSLSEMIRTRHLTQEMADKVNDLQQKVQQRGYGERVGRLMSKVINTIGLNTPKGMIEYFLGRGTGLKTLNALDLEKNLAKNLKKLKSLTEGSEDEIAKKLESFLAKSKK